MERSLPWVVCLGISLSLGPPACAAQPPPPDHVWIPHPRPAPARRTTRDVEPAPRAAKGVHTEGRQPHHFWYLHQGEESERREWLRVDRATWEERYPSGAVIRFRIIGRFRDGEYVGVLVRRIPDEALEVLIPDLDSAGWPRSRVAPDGDFHDLGQMHVIE